MKFLRQPNNGASWQEPLLYAVALDDEDGGVARVRIETSDTQQLIARFNIYGGNEVEFDIAPYLRNSIDDTPTSGERGLFISPYAFNVVVNVNGYSSSPKCFYRTPLQGLQPGIISRGAGTSTISRGERIQMTLYAQSRVDVTVMHHALRNLRKSYAINSNGCPVELIYPLAEVDEGLQRVVLSISVDGQPRVSVDIPYVERSGPQRQVMWYGGRGGTEGYLFPQCVLKSREAITERGADGKDRVVARDERWLLTSAYETPEEMERIEDMIFADKLYFVNAAECEEVVLQTRKLNRGDAGELKRMQIEVTKRQRGGGL